MALDPVADERNRQEYEQQYQRDDVAKSKAVAAKAVQEAEVLRRTVDILISTGELDKQKFETLHSAISGIFEGR